MEPQPVYYKGDKFMELELETNLIKNVSLEELTQLRLEANLFSIMDAF